MLTLTLVAACVLAFLAVAGRPLFFASVDGPLARASRVPVRSLAVAFLLVLGLAVAATVQITGVLLVFALLVAPAGIARELTARIGLGLALSVLARPAHRVAGPGSVLLHQLLAGLLLDDAGDRPVRAGAGARAARATRATRAARSPPES